MQFFFPFTLPADQEQVYQVAKQQAERAGRTKMSERRFHAVSYKTDGTVSRPLDDTTLDCFGYLSEMIPGQQL